MASVTFKTKLRTVDDRGNDRRGFTFKKTVGRIDCDLKPHQHKYYNSDLFPAMLNRAYREVIGQYADWVFLDNLPSGVSVDDSGFFAVITVSLPESFNR